MTIEECRRKLQQIRNEYHKQAQQLESKRQMEIALTLDTWAMENTRFQIGDIIQSYDTIIKVEKIKGYESEYYNSKGFYCIYMGHVLTKKLQLRKDEWQMSIYDDGREIKLIRKNNKDD